MKRFLCAAIALCMVICALPAVSFAKVADEVTAVRTAYFNTDKEWKLTDDSTGSDNVLASTAEAGWGAPNTFTDEDGSVTTKPGVSGTNFGSARNALIAFQIPANVENAARITLSMTIKNVKQVSAGSWLAVYGNSLEGEWDLSTGKEAFGVSGKDSGLSKLTLLGLSDSITVGSSDGEIASNQTVKVSSFTLTNYVKQMAKDGKSEVTFRLAAPLGGIRIYDNNTQNPPKLTIETGDFAPIEIKEKYLDGENVVKEETIKTVTTLLEGESYTYTDAIESPKTVDGDIYIYDAEASTLTAVAGEGAITIVYNKYSGDDTFSGYQISGDEGAWCWFADPRSITYTNEAGDIDVTIIGYIDNHGDVKATQINNLTNKVDEVLIRSNLQPDDHNNPTFLVLPDERIMVFYSRHTDEKCFWYRVSEEPGDITTLGEEKCLLTDANTTYPSPFILKDDPDHIYLCWRGINWHPTIAKLDIPDENGDTKFVYGPYQMVSTASVAGGIRPYAKYASNGKDKIYVTYTTGHPDNVQPNWLYLNQIDIATMTLEDLKGNTLSTIAEGPLEADNKDTNQSFVLDATPGMRDWVWQTAIADDGNPVVAMVKINGGKTSHDYYYAKWNGTDWVKTPLANGGGHFHQTPGVEMCYSGGMAIDPDDTNIVYCSVPTEGAFGKVYEIIKYTMSEDGGEVVSKEQITKNSMKNNVRPFIIPGSEGKDLRLIWMSGDYYYWIFSNQNGSKGFPTKVMGEADIPRAEVNLENGIVANKDYEDIGGAYKSIPGAESFVYTEPLSGQFSVSADIYAEGAYSGKLLDLGTAQLSIETVDKAYGVNGTGSSELIASRPALVLTVNGERYVSENIYADSDNWINFGGTSGQYGYAKYDEFVNLTLVYDGDYLTLYRKGLVDMKIKLADFGIEKVNVGGFEGFVENAAVYDRALNTEEIRTMAINDYVKGEPSLSNKVVKVSSVAESGEVLRSEEITLPNGTDSYEPAAEDFFDASFMQDGKIYVLVADSITKVEDENGISITAEYKEQIAKGDNIIENGSFEDEEGNFSLEGWLSAQTGQTLGSPYETDHSYAVTTDRVINNNGGERLTENTIPDGKWALGTRWNDGENGLCSVARFVPVEAGKTYYVSYDYKHKQNNPNGGEFIRTTFQKNNVIGSDDSADNNTPVSITTDWQTNEFVITAPEDGYIYFHFYWLGSGGADNNSTNNGSGPYWFFDNFKIYAVGDREVSAEVKEVTETTVTVTVTNDSAENISDIKVYAAALGADETVQNVASETISIEAGAPTDVTLNVGGNVKVFVWDSDTSMRPLTTPVEAKKTE